MFIRIYRILFLLGILSLGSCSHDDAVNLTEVPSLPSRFRLVAEASTTDSSGTTVECSLYFIFELQNETLRTPQSVVYKGVHGGEVFRRILNREGAGFEFFADAFGEVEAYLQTNTGLTVLRAPGNENSTNQFWRNLARFDAIVGQNGNGFGTWTCAPLEFDEDSGYVDNTISAQGSFHLEPIQ